MIRKKKRAPDHSRKSVYKEIYARASQNHELVSFLHGVERKAVGIQVQSREQSAMET